MSDLPFLTDEKDMAEAVEAEQPVQPEHEPEPKGEPEPAAPPAAEPEESKHVPLTALLDERDKRKQREQEAEELRRRLAEYEARNAPQPKPIDPVEDPQGYAAQVQQAMQAAIIRDRYERSLEAAVEAHGKETVDAVVAFFNDPKHAPKTQEFIQRPDPFKAAFRYYQEQKEVEEVRSVGGVAALREKIAAEIRAELEAKIAQPAPKAPPPSMAATPGTGSGKEPPASGFAALFERE